MKVKVKQSDFLRALWEMQEEKDIGVDMWTVRWKNIPDIIEFEAEPVEEPERESWKVWATAAEERAYDAGYEDGLNEGRGGEEPERERLLETRPATTDIDLSRRDTASSKEVELPRRKPASFEWEEPAGVEELPLSELPEPVKDNERLLLEHGNTLARALNAQEERLSALERRPGEN